ncbi:hypothetical protein [Pseudobdellovibrio exovorus]|uniref:Lipoprotein n=1 Tax=Pseudobdellovibrio exovorus JSS TaxID=1184267 RepID=M4V876_9BACT|nr:hypothetical protein [Pseudobdellovibrio exovorus]AGH94650.1 hypothetical protein A11Q_430 [Pseudobdellovibrio exovorus JSS]
MKKDTCLKTSFAKKLILSVFLTQAVGVASAWAACQIPTGNESSSAREQNRLNCLAESRFLNELPALDSADFQRQIVSPRLKGKLDLQNGQDVYCRFHYQSQNGNSTKFRCARTNEQNQLYDSKGELVPEAVNLIDENDDVYLADRQKKKIENRKAQIFKVRYSDGNSRNVENYVSVAASRILWAMGVPAHNNIMTNRVMCFGCEKSPFRKQQAPLADRRGNYVLQAFPDASIEFKYEGKRMYAPTQNPWSWSEVNTLLDRGIWDHNKRLESEVFALANHFLGFTSDAGFQNALVCTERDSTNNSICLKSLAFVHDIGASFGNRAQKRTIFNHTRPRGDIEAYEESRIFKNNTCEFTYSSSDGKLPRNISRQAQDMFLARAQNLNAATLKQIISASRIARIKFRGNAQELEQRENRWVQALLNKVNEVRQASCP